MNARSARFSCHQVKTSHRERQLQNGEWLFLRAVLAEELDEVRVAAFQGGLEQSLAEHIRDVDLSFLGEQQFDRYKLAPLKWARKVFLIA